MRPVAEDGTTGDWTPLGTLVRTPQITAIHCTTADAPTCTVDGSNLFLVQSFDAAKDFAAPVNVPTGFAEDSFSVPTPADGTTVYLKLRDDPNAIAAITLPERLQKPAPGQPPTAQSPSVDSNPTPSPQTSPSPTVPAQPQPNPSTQQAPPSAPAPPPSL
jgi:hypothetical protein